MHTYTLNLQYAFHLGRGGTRAAETIKNGAKASDSKKYIASKEPETLTTKNYFFNHRVWFTDQKRSTNLKAFSLKPLALCLNKI